MKIKFLQDFRGVLTNENYFKEGETVEISDDNPWRITEAQARQMADDGRVKILGVAGVKAKTAKKKASKAKEKEPVEEAVEEVPEEDLNVVSGTEPEEAANDGN